VSGLHEIGVVVTYREFRNEGSVASTLVLNSNNEFPAVLSVFLHRFR
jgi:hypothetical protein